MGKVIILGKYRSIGIFSFLIVIQGTKHFAEGCVG